MAYDMERIFKPAGSEKMVVNVVSNSLESIENNEALKSRRISLS